MSRLRIQAVVLCSRAYTPQGYATPTGDKTRPVRASTTTPTSAQMSAIPLSSSAPKAFYGKSRDSILQPEDINPSPSNANTSSRSDSSNSKTYVCYSTLIPIKKVTHTVVVVLCEGYHKWCPEMQVKFVS